jgi:Lar family restriction alleviation protein
VKDIEKFESCPFCGVEDGDHDEGVPFIHVEQFGRRFRVVCGQCGAKSGARNSPSEATKAWNTRAGA